MNANQYFNEGMAYFNSCNLIFAYEFFYKAYKADPPPHLKPAIQSYLGFSMVAIANPKSEEEEKGFKLMHQAIDGEYNRSDLFLNLARAYLFRKHNQLNAMTVFKKALKFCSYNRDALEFWNHIGRRQTVPLQFLSRKNRLNRWLGQIKHNRASHHIS